MKKQSILKVLQVLQVLQKPAQTKDRCEKRKTTRTLSLTAIMLFVGATIFAQGSPRMAETEPVFTAAGSRDGISTICFTTKFEPRTRIEIGRMEGERSIDTPEEAMTAIMFYRNQLNITCVNAQSVINRELPKTKDGVKKLGAMWMKKMAENPENKSVYENAIAKVIEKAKSEFNINVTRAEITDYYNNAIEKLVIEKATPRLRSHYSPAEIRSAVQPIVNYYRNPSEANLQRMADAIKNSKHRTGYGMTISDLNPKLGNIAAGRSI